MRKRRLGPRGLRGIFGWTFFDPANLVSVSLLATAVVLTLRTLSTRDHADVPMAGFMYLCMAGLLRGYFFTYYHGRSLGRLTLLLMNLLGLMGSAALWIERAGNIAVLRPSGLVVLPESRGLQVAGLLHLVVAATLALHLLVPRRWMIKATDEIADRTGRDQADDAPLESIEDPAARAAVAAARAATVEARRAADAALVAKVERVGRSVHDATVGRVIGRRAGKSGELAQVSAAPEGPAAPKESAAPKAGEAPEAPPDGAPAPPPGDDAGT